jgi:peroxiredoxin
MIVPLEGPPTLEGGAFVEIPRQRVTRGQSWDVGEEGRPVRTWQVAGSEMVNGTSCLKLVGVQESDDWERPRGDRTAWRRQDTVWMAPRLGIAYKVERVIERREPARQEPTQRSALRYELETNLQYPGQLFDDRRREIIQAHHFAESAAPLLSNPTRYSSQLDALLGKITSYLDRHPPTPYREAVLQVKRRVEAGRRGETPPALPEAKASGPQIATLNRTAPDFVAPDFTSQESARLRRWHGRPILMVFYSPTSMTGDELLRFAQSVSDRYPQEVTVLGLAMTDDAERVRKQRGELRLTFPLLNGTGLRQSYEVEATPKLVVLDADGVVRGTFVGWGRETPLEVTAELKRWLPREAPPKEPERKK